jgi:pro-apoptotic serine protease NMA111
VCRAESVGDKFRDSVLSHDEQRMSMQRIIELMVLMILLLSGAAHSASPEVSDPATGVAQVADGVVTIEYRVPRAFDTYGPATGLSATGFVVDAERGIIMTNRHVVLPGPVVARGVFHNGEELPLRPLYRDPVHDFGFYSYDPKKLEYTEVRALELHPQGAQVGAHIRVVGNDNSRKLLVQDGEISRLDHNAPGIGGRLSYQDWNTFYLVASTGSSGGSSGSPVVDGDGRVVALMSAANSRSLTAFFLPLDRAKRALELLQKNQPVTRGTVQTIFVHKAYNELRRIGLTRKEEAAARVAHPDSAGLLSVGQILPAGPADGILQAGDILLAIDGQKIADFATLASILDAHIGSALEFLWLRDGTRHKEQLTVQDLEVITPAAFLELGGDIVHELSYQIARHAAVQVGGVFVADANYALRSAGIPRGAVITEVAETPTPTLDDFERAWAAQPHGARVGFRYYMPDTPGTERVHVVRIERRWFEARRCERDDAQRFWSCRQLAAAPTTPLAKAPARRSGSGANPSDRFRGALVNVEFTTPYGTDGMSPGASSGVGLVVDEQRGYVVVTRSTVNTALGDAELTFLARTRVPAEVVWLDPRHGFALLRYDPAKLAGLPIRALPMSRAALKAGDSVQVVGIVNSGQVLGRKTQVKRMVPLELPLPHPPRYYARDLDVITLLEPPNHISGGVLLDSSGQVVGLWGGLDIYSHAKRRMNASRVGFPASVIMDAANQLSREGGAQAYDPGFEFRRVTLRYAQDLGVPEHWLVQLEKAGGERPGALQVRRRSPTHDARKVLEDGDLLLAVNGDTPAIFAKADELLSRMPCSSLDLFRRGNIVKVDVCAAISGDTATRRVVWWNGLALHNPHPSLAARRSEAPRGVYISSQSKGSPAKVGLASNLVVAVNGTKTPNLESFLSTVKNIAAGDLVVLQVRALDGNEARHGFYHDTDYWPGQEFNWTEDGWARRPLE